MHQIPFSFQINIALSRLQGKVNPSALYGLPLGQIAELCVNMILPSRPQPHIEVIQHFVDVYRTKVHLQPLPLFHLENLADQLLAGPEFVLWSFLSLMLMISSHDFFKGQENLAKDFYARSSEDIVMGLSSGGELTSDVTRSLCLIALKHLKCNHPYLYLLLAAAWLTKLTSLPTSSSLDGYWECFAAVRYACHVRQERALRHPR